MRLVAFSLVVIAGSICFAAGVVTQTGAGGDARSTGYLIMIAGGSLLAVDYVRNQRRNNSRKLEP